MLGGGAAGGTPLALAYLAFSAASDPTVREVALTAATSARRAAEVAAQAAAEAAATAAAVVSAHSQGDRYCLEPLHAGLLALAVVLVLLAAGLLACCSVGTLPLGVLGGHVWGRFTARSPLPAAVAPALAASAASAAAASDLVDENYTLTLAESIIERGCQPAALAATAIEFETSPEAVAQWLQAYRDAVAGPRPDERRHHGPGPGPHRRHGPGRRTAR